MRWRDGFVVVGGCADGGEGTFVDDALDLDDGGVEDVDVRSISFEYHFEMLLEERHHPLPHSPVVGSAGRNEFPLEAAALESGSGVAANLRQFLLQDAVGGCEICTAIRREGLDAGTTSSESDDRVDG